MKGTNENISKTKRIQLYKNKGNISNFNTTYRTNLNKFKIDLSKDLRYKFLNKYGAKDDFNFDIYIFPPSEDVQTILNRDKYGAGSINSGNNTITYTKAILRTVKTYPTPKLTKTTAHNGYTYQEDTNGAWITSRRDSNPYPNNYGVSVTNTHTIYYVASTYNNGTRMLVYNPKTGEYSISDYYSSTVEKEIRSVSITYSYYNGSTSGH